jgi:hypothetical protein
MPSNRAGIDRFNAVSRLSIRRPTIVGPRHAREWEGAKKRVQAPEDRCCKALGIPAHDGERLALSGVVEVVQHCERAKIVGVATEVGIE